jgi:hypothetical protein
MNPETIAQLLQLGPAGLLFLAVVYLLREREQTRQLHVAEITEVRRQLQEEHKARLDDARANTVALLEVHDQMVQVLQERHEKRGR